MSATSSVAAGEQVAFLFLGDVWSVNVPHFRRWRYALACLSYPMTLSRVGRFPGRITLFRAREQNHRTRRLQYYFGDVHHEMMHGANARGFARVLQECLDPWMRTVGAIAIPMRITSCVKSATECAPILNIARAMTARSPKLTVSPTSAGEHFQSL